MSARPFVPRLSDEELDLLLSRSLDGDLSPEEEHGLETILAHDPAAARRKEELQRLVAEARALPEPAPPFALATRVNSNVSEKAGHGGSVFHRFGFYPPPGMAVSAMALLGIVAVAITVLKPAPLRVVERVEGPVDVFLTEGAKSDVKDAPKQALQEAQRIRSKEPARNEIAAAAPRAQEPAAPAAVVASAPERKLEGRLEGKADDKPVDAEKANSFKKPAEQAPASVIAANEPAFSASEERQRQAAAEALEGRSGCRDGFDAAAGRSRARSRLFRRTGSGRRGPRRESPGVAYEGRACPHLVRRRARRRRAAVDAAPCPRGPAFGRFHSGVRVPHHARCGGTSDLGPRARRRAPSSPRSSSSCAASSSRPSRPSPTTSCATRRRRTRARMRSRSGRPRARRRSTSRSRRAERLL